MARRPLPIHVSAIAALAETSLVVLTVVGISYLRLGPAIAKQGGAPLFYKALTVTTVWQVCLYYTDLYDRRTVLDRPLTMVRATQAFGAAALGLAVIYFWFPSLALGRAVMFITLALLPALAVIWRSIVDWHLRHRQKRERLLIVGTDSESLDLAHELHRRRNELALEIVGFVDRDEARVGTPLFNPSIVGSLGKLGEAIESRSADRVAVSATSTVDDLSLEELLRLRFEGVTFDHLAAVYEEYTGKLAVEALTPAALMSSAGFRRHSWLAAVKRIIDIMAASIGLLLACPLMLIAAVLIKATSRGPVFYHQKRVGRSGRTFAIHKLRTMRSDAEDETGPVWASHNDPRVTSIGRLLRATRFDEVPQLWNVLRGEMSLVGPRPERPEIEEQLLEEIPLYAQRRLVKPGITGWAQVRHSYGGSIRDAHIKLQYDLFYLKNMSLALDFLIILMTTKTILRGLGAR